MQNYITHLDTSKLVRLLVLFLNHFLLIKARDHRHQAPRLTTIVLAILSSRKTLEKDRLESQAFLTLKSIRSGLIFT